MLRELSYGFSSVGRALVSKTKGREFEPSNPCKNKSDMLKRFVDYCKTCYEELAHKTTWPTMAQLTHSAMVVLSASLVIALIVFAMDFVFENLMKVVYPG